jgi:hypothetical protein
MRRNAVPVLVGRFEGRYGLAAPGVEVEGSSTIFKVGGASLFLHRPTGTQSLIHVL